MKTLCLILRHCIAVASMGAIVSTAAFAQDAPRGAITAAAIQIAQSDCYSIGQQVAAQNGGTLAKASQAEKGGQAVCIIVVLVPGKNGQRPRRTEIVVPQQ